MKTRSARPVRIVALWLVLAASSSCHKAASRPAPVVPMTARTRARANPSTPVNPPDPGLALAPTPSWEQVAPPPPSRGGDEFVANDAHVHLTNYVQRGTDVRELLKIMGKRVERAALFGIPLQQTWSYRVSGTSAPDYYLDTDAPVYYYSFIDAYIAMAYRSLTPAQKARFEPMICGFNPADMYGVDHIRRVLLTFPGVFTGIGEFTIHKEFVSGKVAGEVPSLRDPAIDRIFEFAGEAGLVVLLHNDIDRPFADREHPPSHFANLLALFRRHPNTTVIWAHLGLGRVIHPVKNQAAMLETILADPDLSHVYFDISWVEVAKYLLASPEATRIAADLMNRYPDRFLFGTDAVAPESQKEYYELLDQYAGLWGKLTPEASYKVRKGNFARLFDAAAKRVRRWERVHVNEAPPPSTATLPSKARRRTGALE